MFNRRKHITHQPNTFTAHETFDSIWKIFIALMGSRSARIGTVPLLFVYKLIKFDPTCVEEIGSKNRKRTEEETLCVNRNEKRLLLFCNTRT